MKTQHVSVLDILDKLLEKGAVVKGDVLLSVADVDLVYLNLQLLLSSIATLQKGIVQEKGNEEFNFVVKELEEKSEKINDVYKTHTDEMQEQNYQENDIEQNMNRLKPLSKKATKIKMDEKNVEKGLAKLVLVLVNLLRKLMERQAVRKMEQGQLSAEETEKIGRTFLLLDKRIVQLKKVFQLEDEELNLDLGPLGKLV